MPRISRRPGVTFRRVVAGVTVTLLVGTANTPATAWHVGAEAPAARGAAPSVDLASLGWVWPAEPFRLARRFVAPAHEYGPGHRGIDLDLLGGSVVRAPADGVVAFAGDVAGRGILTIDHGDGLVTTLEPVETALTPGAVVSRGEDVADLSVGGHAAAGTLHFGVRLHGAYINPMLLLGGVPRAVLLPCCD